MESHATAIDLVVNQIRTLMFKIPGHPYHGWPNAQTSHVVEFGKHVDIRVAFVSQLLVHGRKQAESRGFIAPKPESRQITREIWLGPLLTRFTT